MYVSLFIRSLVSHHYQRLQSKVKKVNGYRYDKPRIHIIKAETAEGTVAKVIKDLHFSPIRQIKFCSNLDLVLSTDDNGFIELWDPETYEFPEDEQKLKFQLVSDTDLLDMVKNKTCTLSVALSNNGNMIAMLCKDRKIRIFRIIDGKLLKTIDESLQKYMDEQLNIK